MQELILFGTGLVILALGYSCWNLLRKNEELEDAINAFYYKTNRTILLMREIDARKIFEEDDEVGQTFRLLSDAAEEMYRHVTEIRDDDENE